MDGHPQTKSLLHFYPGRSPHAMGVWGLLAALRAPLKYQSSCDQWIRSIHEYGKA